MRVAAGVAWAALAAAALHTSSDPAVLDRWSEGWARVVGASLLVAAAVTVLNLPGPMAWLHRVRFQAAALPLGALLTLGLMEVAVRALDLLGVSYYEESKRYHLEKIADDDLVYAHRPGWATRYQSVDVVFNELGFRDGPVEPRSPGELRILMLGDSVTFGWGVEQDEVFASRLEQILQRELGRHVVVVNTGVGSYNTVQQRGVLRRHGDALAPDLVLLLYVYNDVEVHERPFDPGAQFDLSQYNLVGKVDVLLGHSWLYRLVKHVRKARARARGYGAEGSVRGEGWLASMQALRDVAAWCRDRDLPFATYVWRRQPRPGDPLWADLTAVGAAERFPVVEAAPAWVNPRAHRLSMVDGHPDAAGHLELAEALARDLEERGWATPAH